MNPPANPLTPPCKPIDCLPFSFSFSRMSTVPFFGVALDFRGLIRFDLVEIIQLVQPQDTDFPRRAC